MSETNIVVLHDHVPQRIALPDHPPFLRFSRRYRSSYDVCITTKPTSLLLLRFDLFFVKEEKMPFLGETVLECNFQKLGILLKNLTRRRKSVNQSIACMQNNSLLPINISDAKKRSWSWEVSIPLPVECESTALPCELQPHSNILG